MRNFCLFRGRQTIDLSPRVRHGRALPIILFGGLNSGALFMESWTSTPRQIAGIIQAVVILAVGIRYMRRTP